MTITSGGEAVDRSACGASSGHRAPGRPVVARAPAGGPPAGRARAATVGSRMVGAVGARDVERSVRVGRAGL